MAASQYLAQQVVAWIRGVAMPAAPTSLWVALFDAGGTELSGNGYARMEVSSWGTVTEAGGNVSVGNGASVASATAIGDWVQATQFAFYDAVSGGNAITGLTALGVAVTILTGGSATFDADDFTISVPTAELGSYLATEVVEWCTGVAFASAPTCYAGWYTSDPAELSGSGYARGLIAWGAATDSGTAIAVTNSALVASGTATAAWLAAHNFTIHDAASAGNALSSTQAMAASVTIGEGGRILVAAAGLSFQMSYAA